MKHKLLKTLIVLVSVVCANVLYAQSQEPIEVIKKATVPLKQEIISTDQQTQQLGGRGDELVTTTTTTALTYHDTIRTITEVKDSIKRVDSVLDTVPANYHKGHYVQFYVGGGYGSLGYQLKDANGDPSGKVLGGANALIQLQYAYFFHENWGIGIGAAFSNLTSHAQPDGSRYWNGVPDTDNEIHNHTTAINRWNERQTIHALTVPISIQFQHFYKPDRGIFFDLGAAPQFALMNKYKVLTGELEHSAYYEWSRLTLTDMHEFTQQSPESKGDLSARQISASAFADLGFLFKLNSELDFYLGAYGYVNLLDANTSEKKDLGWRTEQYPYMEEFNGMYATNEAGKSIPWAAGLKIGIHWHKVPAPQKKAREWFEPVVRRDTTERLQARVEQVQQVKYDTLLAAVPEPTPVYEPYKTVDFTHIYFDFDKSNIRKDNLENMNNLLKYLQDNPQRKVIINGHACRIGTKSYNQFLSRKRAEAVAKWYEERGIDKSRIEIRSHGFSLPSSDKDHELKLDRRVEVTIVE